MPASPSMARPCLPLPLRTELDSVIDSVRLKLKLLSESHGLPPSRLVQRRLVERLVGDELWQRARANSAGFEKMMDRLLAPDPCCPRLLAAGLWWQRRLVTATVAYELDHLPELLAFAVDQLTKIVLAELQGS